MVLPIGLAYTSCRAMSSVRRPTSIPADPMHGILKGLVGPTRQRRPHILLCFRDRAVAAICRKAACRTLPIVKLRNKEAFQPFHRPGPTADIHDGQTQ